MITFIKRECLHHPGCFTMSAKCERCIHEEFEARIKQIMKDADDRIKAIFVEAEIPAEKLAR